MFDHNFNCGYDVCACSYQFLYTRDYATRLAIQTQKEKESKIEKKKQTNFFEIVQESTAEIVSYEDRNEISNNMSKTSIDLTRNSTLQEGVKKKVAIQWDIRPVSKFVNDKSIPQYREEKRIKRNESKSKLLCHLPQQISVATSSVFSNKDDSSQSPVAVSPNNIISPGCNIRFYNNGLVDNDYSTITSTTQLISSNTTDTISKLEDMIMIRLGDNTSPTSPKNYY